MSISHNVLKENLNKMNIALLIKAKLKTSVNQIICKNTQWRTHRQG